VGESKAERQKYLDREATRREIERKQRQADWPEGAGGGFDRLAASARGYDSLWSHLGSGEFRSLVYRPAGGGGGTFTLKAVLEVQQTAYGVYMYGGLKHAVDLPGLLDSLLLRADWREDKYWRGEGGREGGNHSRG